MSAYITSIKITTHKPVIVSRMESPHLLLCFAALLLSAKRPVQQPLMTPKRSDPGLYGMTNEHHNKLIAAFNQNNSL